jgi:hypothetical protein
MSTRWASGSIAGVDVVDLGSRPCRMDVEEAAGFRGAMVGDTLLALDLTPHTQVLNRAKIGVRFGLKIAQLPVAVLDDIVDAMDAAVAASTDFIVDVADSAGADVINMRCLPDYPANGGGYYQRDSIAGGFVKGVIMRFVVTANP